MQKWEYKFIDCFYHNEEWYPAYENGQDIKNWKQGPSIAGYSNQLGEQGWELVNLATSAAGSHTDHSEWFRLAFKRPKS
jgi:hypothetical protein